MPCSYCDYGGHYGHAYGECDKQEAKEKAEKDRQALNRVKKKAQFERLKKKLWDTETILRREFGYRD